MGAVSSSGRPLVRGGQKKARKLLCLAVSAVALLTILAPIVYADASSAEPDFEFDIYLVDAKGNVITSPLISDYQFQFSTLTTPEGTKYILETGVPIDSQPAFFVIKSDQDLGHKLFRVSVKMEGLAAWMDYYGIRACSDDNSTADLRIGNSYDAAFMENGKVKPFEFDTMYALSFATLDGAQSETVPGSMGDIRITLTAEIIPGCHNIFFYSDHETGVPKVIEKRALYENEPLGPLPQLVYEGNTFEGWLDSNGKEVTENTLVSELPSDDLTAKWEWPLIEHWEVGPVENPDGSTTLTQYTRWTYRDGTIKLDVIETTTYPGGDSKKEETSETTDPSGETTDSSSSYTEITVHEDDTETWNTKKESTHSDGSSERYESTAEYDAAGKKVSEKTDAWITEAGKETREYEVNARLVDDKEDVYRVETKLPEATKTDVDNAKKLIEQYNYSIAFVGMEVEDGPMEVSEDVVEDIADSGLGLYVSNNGRYSSVDNTVVKMAREIGGDIVYEIDDANKDEMTDQQKSTVGANYAVDVKLSSGGVEISDLGDGRAEVSIDPSIAKGRPILVNEDGTTTELTAEVDPVTGRVYYTTSHLSIFMIVSDEDDGDDIFWALIIGTLVMFTLIPTVAVIIYRRRRKKEMLGLL